MIIYLSIYYLNLFQALVAFLGLFGVASIVFLTTFTLHMHNTIGCGRRKGLCCETKNICDSITWFVFLFIGIFFTLLCFIFNIVLIINAGCFISETCVGEYYYHMDHMKWFQSNNKTFRISHFSIFHGQT